MNVSLLDNILWAGTFVGHSVLFIVLIFRSRWKQFPVFATLISFYILRTIVLFVLFYEKAYGLYRWVYWPASIADIGLQIALIFEIARIVLRPTGTWVQDARASFLTWGGFGAVMALGLSYVVHPVANAGFNDWMIRGNLFTSLLFCELFLAMMFSAHRLGLVWRNHVMGLGQGLTIWALVSTMVDIVHSYFGQAYHFATLEHVRICAYLVATIYWIVTLWFPEPERKPLSSEMQQYLVALHAKVQYDSSQVSSVQNTR